MFEVLCLRLDGKDVEGRRSKMDCDTQLASVFVLILEYLVPDSAARKRYERSPTRLDTRRSASSAKRRNLADGCLKAISHFEFKKSPRTSPNPPRTTTITGLPTGIMTPEEIERAPKSLSRYNERFDPNVDQHLPADLVKTKKGAIAKRQPHYPKRTQAYYKAQCSFRGLRTTGSTDELQQILKFRDRSNDVRVKQALDRTRELLDAEYEKQEKESAERWWNDPARTLEEKANEDAMRALRESLMKEDLLTASCAVLTLDAWGLERAAQQLGLAYQLVNAPRSMCRAVFGPASVHIVGSAKAVRQRAKQISDEAAEEERQIEEKRQAALAARREAMIQKQRALLSEAMRMEDWDLTGEWVLKCDALATYSSNTPARLSMTIYRDDFDISNPAKDEPRSDDEEDEFDSAPLGYAQYAYAARAPPRPVAAAPTRNPDPTIPRFCAEFNFAVIEGIMRLYPQNAGSSKNYKIKDRPAFDYVWRGRETGESVIQLEAEGMVHHITFGNHGTSFEGTYKCPYIAGELAISGIKVSHGRRQKLSSAQKWSDLSERAYDEECVGRWH